jgi:hypothetical protein
MLLDLVRTSRRRAVVAGECGNPTRVMRDKKSKEEVGVTSRRLASDKGGVRPGGGHKGWEACVRAVE